jgi:putative FmdB family regulatory protein
MPLYAYQCEACEHDFEAVVSVKSADEAKCPQCDSAKVTRKFSTVAKPLTAATNCRGDGPPCGLPQCGRQRSG